MLEQIEKQLSKLVDVESVVELDGSDYVERELVLIKVCAPSERRPEILSLVDIFGAKIPLVQKDKIVLELSGSSRKVENFISLVSDYGDIEVARSGRTAIPRK